MEQKGVKILLADDEEDILEIIRFNLTKEGYEVFTATNGHEAIQMAKRHLPALIILDNMMPYKTGMEVCEILRAESAFHETLILMLTAMSDEGTQVKALDTGADDYIAKPVSPKVLVSRVNALVRRTKQISDNKVLEIHNLTIDPVQFIVVKDGKSILLAKKEFELLYLLAAKPGRVFLRNEILNTVWGADVIVGDRTIDVHIRKIRQKLDVDYITTVKGVGYKFVLPE
jgi:two-component system, OmpR family, alkaline phosphatase synthesis response regulator PhoP